MKRIITLLLALLVIIIAFSGCGNSIKDRDRKSDTNKTKNDTQTEGTYNYASGKFAADDKGLAKEKYDYPLPLTTTEEVLTYWTCCYAPDYLPADYGESPFPAEVEKKTGVNIEYMVIESAGRRENFYVLLASDSLPDIMSQPERFYNGDFKSAILDDKYFVNLYDYRDYMPNYIYEVRKDAGKDKNLYDAVFLEDKLIGSFYCLKDDVYITNGMFIRGDWLKKLGINRDDIVTWDDTYNVLKAFQSGISTAKYPAVLLNTIDVEASHWICFDTAAYVNPHGMTAMVDEKGRVFAGNTCDRDYNLMKEISKWFSEGLFDPNWMSYNNMNSEGLRQSWLKDELGYMALTVADLASEQSVIDDPDCSWLPLPDPVLNKGQVLHLGKTYGRLNNGSASVSAGCKNIKLAVTWLDWRYSGEGADLMSYGAEGYAWEYDEKGEKKVSEFIYNNPEKAYSIITLTLSYCNDTLYDPGLDIVKAHYKYPGGRQVIDSYQYLETVRNDDGAFIYPSDITLTEEQKEEAIDIELELTTYITENYLAFVDGSKPMSEWGSYIEGLNKIGLKDYLAVYQEAYDVYRSIQ